MLATGAPVGMPNPTDAGNLEQRVSEAAEAALAARRFVTAIDVLVGLGWLAPARVDEWRQGRVDHLEHAVQASLPKISAATKHLRRWARDRGLVPSETAYVARTRDRRPLRFSASGDPGIERAYRTHWVSPALSEDGRRRLAEREGRPPELVVIRPLGDFACTACAGGGGLLVMEGPGPLCLTCADLDHLVFLPSGDAALTRRAKKASALSAVVVRFSRSRKRYERQGVLVEEAALDRAERECLADEEARARRRLRDEERRASHDRRFEVELAAAICRLYPGCPISRAEDIARHTAARGSGRIGRSAASRRLDPEAIALAVAASVRHEDTGYDELLMSGVPRAEARERVRSEVQGVLERWQAGNQARRQ
ncbi:MAG: hypothetical protein QOK40_2420 [Miltoncostaeaceae bacterium]|nr:hypothetical protein [Miltoncostaeaceae bacterium]